LAENQYLMERWRRLNGQSLGKSLMEAVEETIMRETEMGNRLKVCIGTDSLARADGAEFATVIVFLREKRGGFMFIRNWELRQNISLKERMLLEVGKSIEVGYELCSLLDKYNVEMEIHADINTDPLFKSNAALQEAVGYIKGMGFAFKTKPDAFASSSCADKVV